MKLLFSCALLCGLFLTACTRNFLGKGKYIFKVTAPEGYKALPIQIDIVDSKGNPVVIKGDDLKGSYNSDSSEFTSEPVEVGERIKASAFASAKTSVSDRDKTAILKLQKTATLKLQLLRGKKVVREAEFTGTRFLSHSISMPYIAGQK